MLCLRLPLEGDFGMQNTVHDLFLGLGCLVGDSLTKFLALPNFSKVF